MSLHLPQPIADYFAADARDGEAVAQCFTEDAVVKDEGNAYHGQVAIQQWKTDASQKYRYTTEPLLCEEGNGDTIVTSRLTGDFPGSPVDLRYRFRLDSGKIASLEIAP